MSSDKKVILPEMKINDKWDKISVGKGGPNLSLNVNLFGPGGNKITSFNEVGTDTKAKLTLTITGEGSKNPDPKDFIVLSFINRDWLKKDSKGFLEIPANKEVEFKQIINKMSSDFISHHFQHFGEERGGVDKPNEGLEGTDMKYKIERNYGPSSNVRVDLYSSSNSSAPYKPIVEDNVKVELYWNRTIKTDLQSDYLNVIPNVDNENKEISKWWLIGGTGLLVLILAILFFFRKRISAWFRKRKEVREYRNHRDQLKVF